MNTFGDRLKKLRTSQKPKMSQKEFGKLFGLSESAVGMYERNERKPDYDVLQKIADFYDVTTDYLLGRTNNPSPPQDLAAHRSDDHMDDLPEEAIRAIEEYKDYIRQKYGRKNRDGEF